MKTTVAIVGAGPGGYVAAVRAAQLGARVALVEKVAVGGTCLNRGCIPSKVMQAAAHTLMSWQNGQRFGLSGPGPARVELARLMEHKDRVVADQIRGIEHLLRHQGVDLIRGRAMISGQGELQVFTEGGEQRTIAWDRLILAAGSRPAPLPQIPFDGERVISSDDVFQMNEMPGSLLIVGGGAIGCEFATIFAALGARVTLVEALERLLPQPSVDPDCSRTLAREMKKRNIEVLLGHTVVSARQKTEGLEVSIAPAGDRPGRNDPGTQRTGIYDRMLVCIGRRPDSGQIGLETIGLKPDDKGWLRADDRMETGREGVYAIGDALGPDKVMLAHVASAEGVVAAENALEGESTMSYRAVPNAVYSIPEVAGVGLTEALAEEQGLAVRSASVLYRAVGKAHAIGETAGQAKIVWQEETGRVLGLHIAGARATDLIAEGILALKMNSGIKDLAETIHAHPTLSEVIMETALKADGRPRHG